MSPSEGEKAAADNMIGQLIAHYEILEKIGEGGMGIVYKAEDTKLKRAVALKFLPPELTKDSQAKARFVQEAQAAAALDHPNICTVHEIGEAEGATYIVMPYVKGQSLKERIEPGPLPIEEALKIAGQVAEGLKEAHENGIIHRDIKPANIMLTEKGQAKIMDFGLAKLASGADVTKTLTVMGTIAYMSPEQARGEVVDHRTDIWSFGATLYEMLTGQMPFGRKRDRALFYSILNETAETASRIRPEISQNIERIILRALEKDKSRRYQNMAELLKDLNSVQVAKPSMDKAEKSIIVLPFEDISSSKDNEYFCDGMTEEIITDLSHVHDLLVISRSSAMTFRGTKKTIPEIAHGVNVRYVLEGSVRKAANNLRITSQLIDATNDSHIWAEKYSGTLDDVFDIQEKVSRSIVEALKLMLTSEEAERIAARPIDNTAAYECYLKAIAEIYKMTGDAMNRAIRNLQDALDIMGDNALLYSGMAFAYLQLVNIGVEHEESLVKAEGFAKKALALDQGFAKAHAMLGWIACWSDPREANAHFKKAISISPDDSFVLMGYLVYYVQEAGKIAAAAQLLERLVRIDPLDFGTKWMQGGIRFYNGEYSLALTPWQRLYELNPENPIAQFYLAATMAYLGKLDSAFSIIDQGAKATPNVAFTKLGLVLKYAWLKDKDKVLREMSPDFRKTCQRDITFSHHLAGIFTLLGEEREALDWLENAANRGFINYPLLAEKDPWLANIRGEARFQKLMDRVKYEWEHFEV
jgi:eukaryotic-like serine/threonine-protein kinase